MCSVCCSVSTGPSKISCESGKAKRRIRFLKDRARGGISVIKLAPHADALRALAREEEGRFEGVHRFRW